MRKRVVQQIVEDDLMKMFVFLCCVCFSFRSWHPQPVPPFSPPLPPSDIALCEGVVFFPSSSLVFIIWFLSLFIKYGEHYGTSMEIDCFLAHIYHP
jgi:hypothetical protein